MTNNMSTAYIYARNLLANWFGHAANTIVLFFLSPFVVHTLGSVEYGIWSLLSVLTGYMGVLDLGIRASAGRYIILYTGRGDHDKVNQTVRTALGIFSIIGVFILATGAVLGWIFPSVFSSVAVEYHGLVKLLLPLLAANMWISALRVVFSSVLKAHDRFDLSNAVDLLMLALRTVGTVLVLIWGYGILGLTLVVVGCNLVGLAGNLFLAHRVYPPLRIWPLMFSRERLRELYSYGIFAFISAVAVRIIGQTNLVIAGMAFDVATVTVYSVGAMLIFYSWSFIGLIGNTFFPPVQRAVARNEMGSARWLFFRQVRLAVIFGLPLYAGYIFFSEPFIELWMFEPEAFPMESVRQAALVMTVLAVSKLPMLVVIGSGGLLAAMGHVRLTAILGIIEAILNLGLSLLFVLVLDWGLVGIAAGTLVARILVGFFVMLWFTCQKTGISLRSFVLEICGRSVLVLIAFAGLCMVIRWNIPSTSWFLFFLQVGLVLACYFPLALLILLPANDRKRVWQYLRSRKTQIGVHQK